MDHWLIVGVKGVQRTSFIDDYQGKLQAVIGGKYQRKFVCYEVLYNLI